MSPAPVNDDEKLAALLRQAPLQSAPDALVRRAIALFDDAPQPLLQRLAALLRFDSAVAVAAGVRGSAAPRVRQLVFTAPGCDVDLRIERLMNSGRVRVSGQLLGPKPEVQAWLHVGEQQWQTACDELSEFRFDDVPAGATALRLQGSGWELALPTFDTATP